MRPGDSGANRVPKHVVVIASGETERRALPHLLEHLHRHDLEVSVRIPPRNRALSVEMAYKLIQSSLYDVGGLSPDKYVILVDLDDKDPCEVLGPLRQGLRSRLGGQFEPSVQYAYAQRHLEAWFFADATNLRRHVGRALGSVDTSRPDEIQNPKLHLKNLLRDGIYTSRVSEEIAKVLDAETIAQRSQSFHSFLEAVKNGVPRSEPDC